MNTNLSSHLLSSNNHFNLLRLTAALAVIYNHSFSVVTGNLLDEPIFNYLHTSIGQVAVSTFFVVSGMLITKSYFNSGNIWKFALARVLRIYPALIFLNLATVLILGPSLTALPLHDYVWSLETWKYLIRNSLVFLNMQFDLPGLFEHLPQAGVVNSSLWTLPYEVRFYVLTGILLYGLWRFEVFTGRRVTRIFILTIAVLANGFFLYSQLMHLPSSTFLRLFSLFFFGAAAYCWKERIVIRHSLGIPVLTLIALSPMIDRTLFISAYTLLLPYAVLYLALLPPFHSQSAPNYPASYSGQISEKERPKRSILEHVQTHDYSYGVYIYGYPIQQTLIYLIPKISIAEMIIYSCVISLCCAAVSWHLIEKKVMLVKNRLLKRG